MKSQHNRIELVENTRRWQQTLLMLCYLACLFAGGWVPANNSWLSRKLFWRACKMLVRRPDCSIWGWRGRWGRWVWPRSVRGVHRPGPRHCGAGLPVRSWVSAWRSCSWRSQAYFSHRKLSRKVKEIKRYGTTYFFTFRSTGAQSSFLETFFQKLFEFLTKFPKIYMRMCSKCSELFTFHKDIKFTWVFDRTEKKFWKFATLSFLMVNNKPLLKDCIGKVHKPQTLAACHLNNP